MPKYDAVEETTGPVLGALRIGVVSYQHHLIRQTPNGGSIGNMIDEHIAKTVDGGNLISEVNLYFETIDQQEAIANIYKRI